MTICPEPLETHTDSIVEPWEVEDICDEDLLALDDDFDISSSLETELICRAIPREPRGTKRKGSPLADDRATKSPWQSNKNLEPVAEKLLRDKFGLKSFRLQQAQAVARLLQGGNSVIVFPTGGGKSLCYQLPALAFPEIDKLDHVNRPEGSGITLVVSPLIALMKDQTDSLVRRGIPAATLDSTKSREEYLKTCDMMRDGELRLLYVAPERLNNEGFVAQIAAVRGGVRMVAVDEAHCISEWGHAFRPDYLKVARFIKEIKAERVVCLTATATDRVANDICKAFDVPQEGLFRTSTYRPNLHLLTESAATKQDLYPRLFSYLQKYPGSTIVYVTLQKQTEVLANELRKQGFEARAFHAGMDVKIKTELQNEFMENDELIIVATIAFGMGIDKASIRNVIHFNIPSSLESYSQEIGRAGRDGLVSRCMFYVCGEDLHLREVFARGDLPSLESVVGVLEDIFLVNGARCTVGETLEILHSSQETDYDIRATTLKNIYAQLELRFEFLRATTPKYTKYMFVPGASYMRTIQSDNSPAGIAIRTCASSNGKNGKKLKWWSIDVDFAASRSKVERKSIVQKLQDLNERGILELKVSGVLNVYRVLKKLPETHVEITEIADKLYHIMQVREQEALQRTDAVLELIKAKRCFSLALAQHFGDGLPNGTKECGHCTWCMTHQSIIVHKPLPKPVSKAMLAVVVDAVERGLSAMNKKVGSEIKLQDDARLLTRIAFGITSPRVRALGLSKHAAFGSMDSNAFTQLLPAFESLWDGLTNTVRRTAWTDYDRHTYYKAFVDAIQADVLTSDYSVETGSCIKLVKALPNQIVEYELLYSTDPSVSD